MYDLSKGHTRTLGVGGGVNKHLAVVIAALTAAGIGGIWSSILSVDPLNVTEDWHVWPWLALYAFPALVVIVSLSLLPLHFMVLRPAGHKDMAVPSIAVFGGATLGMVAGLLLVSGPNALRDHDIFLIEDRYVRETQTDIVALETHLRDAQGLEVLPREDGGDPIADAEKRLAAYKAEVQAKTAAFRACRIATRNAITNRLGDTDYSRERMLQFDRQAATADRVVEKFWDLHTEYGEINTRYLATLRANRGHWIFDEYGVRLVRGWSGPLAQSFYDMDRVQRDIRRTHTVFRQQPFIDRKVR